MSGKIQFIVRYMFCSRMSFTLISQLDLDITEKGVLKELCSPSCAESMCVCVCVCACVYKPLHRSPVKWSSRSRPHSPPPASPLPPPHSSASILQHQPHTCYIGLRAVVSPRFTKTHVFPAPEWRLTHNPVTFLHPHALHCWRQLSDVTT